MVALGGAVAFCSVMPDAELAAKVDVRAAADPIAAGEGFGYFFTQHDDYVTIKHRIGLGRGGISTLLTLSEFPSTVEDR